MAENKKSFVLYNDILNMVSKLPDEDAGKLFKCILNYVNGNEIEINSLIVDIAFEPVRQQLKRDLEKYRDKCKANKVNGSKGGRPKKKETQINRTVIEKTERFKKEAKKPDSDSDSDSDSDIKEKELPFETFYLKYPVKKSKEPAKRKWKTLSSIEKQAALAGIDGYMETVSDQNYLVHPSTYLNQKRWQDESQPKKNMVLEYV